MNNDPGNKNVEDKAENNKSGDRAARNFREKGGIADERVTELKNEAKMRKYKERYKVEGIKNIKVLGLKDFRNNISDIVYLAINSFQEILTGNAKKGGKTVSLISTELLDNILEGYKFSPSVTFDEATRQYEVILEEIDAAGTGESKEEAIEIAMDNIEALTEDFFDNIELFMRLDQYKKQYPYFMRIKHCEDRETLRKVLNLE